MECRLRISTLTATFWQFLSLSLSVIGSNHMQVAHKATALLMPALGYTAVTSTSPLFIIIYRESFIEFVASFSFVAAGSEMLCLE